MLSRTEEPGQVMAPSGLLRQMTIFIRLAWDFTQSNMFTFIVPNTLFGIASALAGPALVDLHEPMSSNITQRLLVLLCRLPLVFIFNFINLLNFDLSNQRHPESIIEDSLNKPWRPLPTGKVTPEQTRRALHITVPLALLINYALGVWQEGLFIEVLIWYYNDLRGGDELFRDAIIAVAYGLFNQGSLRVAAGPESPISRQGQIWTAVISGVILTTMYVQDLKDQEGDRQRGRKTVPLYFGDAFARKALSAMVLFWSVACPSFWLWRCLHENTEGADWVFYATTLYPMPMGLANFVAWRVLEKRTPQDDSRTWKLWCLWHSVGLYFLPALSRLV